MGPLFMSSLEVQGTFQATKPHWGEVFNTAHDIQLRTAPTGLRLIVRNPCLRRGHVTSTFGRGREGMSTDTGR